MTRFREEYYETRAYKAATARRKAGERSLVAFNERESREEHFKKPPAVRQAILKAQKATRLRHAQF